MALQEQFKIQETAGEVSVHSYQYCSQSRKHEYSSKAHACTSCWCMSYIACWFSDDTERLKYNTGICKAPVGVQMKRVIDLLYESRHDVKEKNQLLKLIRSYMDGIKVIDLKVAYPTVMEDLQALKAAGQVWLLSKFDSQEDIAYPNDPKVPIKVDDDLKQLFRRIELPRDMIDIEKDLQKNRMKPSKHMTQRRLAAQIHGISQKPKLKEKKREISKRTKLTNVHLPELFENLRGS